ncbi:cysteine proteinase [Scenedesmus sp. NREL 46B-D3]|nr:cysteine proteinase [Scenedesmus sp. NREL 46B-D3]
MSDVKPDPETAEAAATDAADAAADERAAKRVKREEQQQQQQEAAQVDTDPQQQDDVAKQEDVQQLADDDEGDERIPMPLSTTRSAVKRGHECPYLDTILRQNLDFDFEKCCSVSLSPINVYVCLVCGKYFQGRGLSTQAYTHSLETSHHMFMKLDNGKVYCLPDNYEVADRSLDDIRAVLNPTFTRERVHAGLVGLNNMKANDYANAVVQVLARVNPVRDFFLMPANYAGCRSLLVARFGELLRKLWNSRNFKGQVSPHEFMQAVMSASKRRFTIEQQSDPVEFWSWLLNTLHMDLTAKRRSIITDTFQGELEVTTLAGTGKGRAATATGDVVERLPFLLMGLELPATPLFKDALEKNIIPQVPIFACLSKFDGSAISDDIRQGRRKFRVTRLPNFLALQFRRFTKNNFFIEKNPTLVTFPVKNLELRDALPVPNGPDGRPLPSKYDLIANVVHEGKAGQQTGGAPYKAHIQRSVEKAWYEVQDLVVLDVLPQMVALSEAYFQVYQCQQLQPLPGSAKSKQQQQQQQGKAVTAKLAAAAQPS